MCALCTDLKGVSLTVFSSSETGFCVIKERDGIAVFERVSLIVILTGEFNIFSEDVSRLESGVGVVTRICGVVNVSWAKLGDPDSKTECL